MLTVSAGDKVYLFKSVDKICITPSNNGYVVFNELTGQTAELDLMNFELLSLLTCELKSSVTNLNVSCISNRLRNHLGKREKELPAIRVNVELALLMFAREGILFVIE